MTGKTLRPLRADIADPEEGPASDGIAMEDILASIRRIMTEDEEPQPAAPAVAPAPYTDPEISREDGDIQRLRQALARVSASDSQDQPSLRPNPVRDNPAARARQHPQSSAPIPGNPPGIFSFLRDRMQTPQPAAPAAAAAPAPATATAPPLRQPSRPAATPKPAAAATKPGTSLEAVAIEALRPLLKEWMATNLRPLVDSIIQREVRRILQEQGMSGQNQGQGEANDRQDNSGSC
ncbi:MAG: DUF2497 domain-containing protein [Pseudomonadota bacterium]|nr:DUF2497 domain-containing protein [Pseudomonadota bacterium]